jgi:chromosome partitioning protein
MAIIAVATSKGGSGKTTLSICLAAYLSETGHTVECLDTDRNKNLSEWIGRSKIGVPCQAVDEDDIVSAARQAALRCEFVIVDVGGGLDRALLWAVGVADFVLIPVKTDYKDAFEAGRTISQIRSVEAMAQGIRPGYKIQHATVLVQVIKRAQVTATTRQQLQLFQIPVLISEVPTRTAYQQASYHAQPLNEDTVRDDISSLCNEILEILGYT